MKKFSTMQDFEGRYIKQNLEATQFIAQHPQIELESLYAFKNRYYRDYAQYKKVLGAKFSERVFSYWLYKEVEQFHPIVCIQDDIMLILPLDNGVAIHKPVDLSFEYNQQKLLIELKTNIDMIEKDVYKFSLYTRFHHHDHIKKILIIWEAHNKRYNKNKTDSQYYSLLKLAVQDGVIDTFIYLPIEQTPITEIFLNDELKKLKQLLIPSI